MAILGREPCGAGPGNPALLFLSARTKILVSCCGEVRSFNRRRCEKPRVFGLSRNCKNFVTKCLTPEGGRSYNPATEGRGAARRHRSRANSRCTGSKLPVPPKRGPASLRVRCIYRGVTKSFPLFDIVDERKRNAGGVCPGGSSG